MARDTAYGAFIEPSSLLPRPLPTSSRPLPQQSVAPNTAPAEPKPAETPPVGSAASDSAILGGKSAIKLRPQEPHLSSLDLRFLLLAPDLRQRLSYLPLVYRHWFLLKKRKMTETLALMGVFGLRPLSQRLMR